MQGCPVGALTAEHIRGRLLVKELADAADAHKSGDLAARGMADMCFFETLVRLHRVGEGEPYTGIKPAGRDLGPAIPAADKAIEQKSAQQLQTLLTGTIQDGLQDRFKNVLAKSSYSKDDVAAGREFVKAYVAFIHYAEQAYLVGKGNPSDAHPGEGHAVAK